MLVVIAIISILAGLLLPAGSSAFLAQIKEARFRRPVVPGDQLRIEASRLVGWGSLHRFAVKAFVEGATAAETEIVLAVTNPGEENR